MGDIVERLINFRPPYGWPEEVSTIVEPPMNEVAAAEILRLRAENEKLRAEVNDLRATLRNCLTDANFMRAAAAALKETRDD